jgi:hypothetical protein
MRPINETNLIHFSCGTGRSSKTKRTRRRMGSTRGSTNQTAGKGGLPNLKKIFSDFANHYPQTFERKDCDFAPTWLSDLYITKNCIFC